MCHCEPDLQSLLLAMV